MHSFQMFLLIKIVGKKQEKGGGGGRVEVEHLE